MTCFRTCSTCQSRSQAPLCHYTLRLVSNQPEGTFARLITFWEATAPVKLPTRQCPRPGLQARVRSPEQTGWYFNVGSAETRIPTSQPPTYPTQSVPSFTVKLQ